MKKRWFSLLLALVMVAGLVPTAQAASGNAAKVVNYAKGCIGIYYPRGFCQSFVADVVNGACGVDGRVCCATKAWQTYGRSSSRSNIPLGAAVYFSGSSVIDTCGQYAGHVGIYIGNDEIVHVWGNEVVKTTIDYVVSCGYPYRGWGWQANLELASSPAPTNPKIATDKSSLMLGDSITITPSATNAGSYEISIWRGAFETGEKVYSKLDFTGSATYKPEKIGNYTIRMDAISSGGRSAGYVSTEETFGVTAAPTSTDSGDSSRIRLIVCSAVWDSEWDHGLGNRGTVDVYINGTLVADNVYVYDVEWPAGTTYEIKDIRGDDNWYFDGMAKGSLSGTLEYTKETRGYLNAFKTYLDNDDNNNVKYSVEPVLHFSHQSHQHSLEHISAKAATEQAEGNIEYWYCSGCGKYFSDSATTREISLNDIAIPKLAHTHTLTAYPAMAATCTENGNLAYWYCESCGKYFSNSAATNEITLAQTVTVKLSHALTHTPAKPSTETAEGNKEYWYCSRCGHYFFDEAATSETTLAAVTLAKLEKKRVDVHFEKQTLYFQGQFTDVPASQWFTSNVAEAYALGLMKGNSGDTFNPYGDVTLAEAITMACRIHSIYTTGEESFVQTGSKWYQVYLDYAYNNGIISRAYYNANVENKATRAQFAEIFANALPDEALYAMNTIADNAIPDVSMSETYAPYVYKLYRAGILTGGDSLGTFSPGTYITRAEAAAIVSRMAESNNRKPFTL